MAEGIVYILTNKSMPDYIKIGCTTRQEIKARMNELYTTGVPFEFKLHYAVKVPDMAMVETTLHGAFSIHRENPKREFFKMAPERAAMVLQLTLLQGQAEEVTIRDDELYDAEDMAIIEKSRRAPAPAFRFSTVGITKGAELLFSRDSTITCIVEDDKNVLYEGELYSLSKLAQILLQSAYGVQGPAYWLYEGKLLTEIRKEREQELLDEE